MRRVVKRLELARVRVCQRCGRGRADLRADCGAKLTVLLDPARTRELGGTGEENGVRSLTELVLEQLEADGSLVREVVLDAEDGVLRALISLEREGGPDLVSCTPQEGVTLVARGGFKLYATDAALAHGAAQPESENHDDGVSGSGGSETLH